MGETVTLRGRKKLYIFVGEAISTEQFSSFFRGGGVLDSLTHPQVHTYTHRCHTVHTTSFTVQEKDPRKPNVQFILVV